MMLGKVCSDFACGSKFARESFRKLITFCQMMIQYLHIKLEIAVAVCCQNLFPKEIVKPGLAISREPHHFPFVAREHIEADVIRDCRVKLSETVRQLDPFQHL